MRKYSHGVLEWIGLKKMVSKAVERQLIENPDLENITKAIDSWTVVTGTSKDDTNEDNSNPTLLTDLLLHTMIQNMHKLVASQDTMLHVQDTLSNGKMKAQKQN